MRRLWAVAAPVVMCLALGGAPALAQEAVGSPPAPSAAAAACFDYNGPLLPGRSRPWLEPLSLGMLPGLPAALDDSACMPGYYLYDNAFNEDLNAWYVLPGIPLGVDGCPLDILDVYRRLMALHPQMGGAPPRLLTEGEKEALEIDEGDGRCFTDAPAGTPPASTPTWGSTDELLAWYATLHLACLSPVPPRIAAGGDSLAADGCSAAPTPTSSPAPSGETRRYRVSVNGHESSIPSQDWKIRGDVRKGVRFDYRLVGEFTLVRTGPSRPWTIASERVTTAEVRVSSLYPADRYRLTLTCVRWCDRLARDLRLYVQVEGDEIIVGWRPFFAEVHVTGTCTGCPSEVDTYLESDFWQRITATRLPLQDLYTSSPTIVRNASGDVVFSFAYGLERRP